MLLCILSKFNTVCNSTREINCPTTSDNLKVYFWDNTYILQWPLMKGSLWRPFSDYLWLVCSFILPHIWVIVTFFHKRIIEQPKLGLNTNDAVINKPVCQIFAINNKSRIQNKTSCDLLYLILSLLYVSSICI